MPLDKAILEIVNPSDHPIPVQVCRSEYLYMLT